MDVSLALRVIAFGATIVWGLVYDFLCSICGSYLIPSYSRLAGLAINDWSSVVPDLCFSTFGIIFFFTFASQKDIINLWRGWSELFLKLMFEVETDVNFRALALFSDSHSSTTEQSSDRFMLSARERKVPSLELA